MSWIAKQIKDDEALIFTSDCDRKEYKKDCDNNACDYDYNNDDYMVITMTTTKTAMMTTTKMMTIAKSAMTFTTTMIMMMTPLFLNTAIII